MGAQNKRYDKLLGEGSDTDRLVFFSDAVFAIAMTLLVIDIAVPDVARDDLDGALLDLLPKVFAYALSFAVIAVNWRGHFRRFRMVTGHDQRLISLNLLLLFFVAFLPFPTSVLSEYGSVTSAVVLYAATVALIGFVQLAQWSYARRHGMLSEQVDVGIYRYVRRNALVAPIVFGCSIAVALLWSGEAAMYSWLASIPASIIVERYEPKTSVESSTAP